MCGIVGTIGQQHDAMDVLIDGLRRLEYRGYDSAGIAVFENGAVAVRKAVGKLANLDALLRGAPLSGQVGIGHTRWATHGKPTERNAHPQRGGSVYIVHNGIIENYRELRREVESSGRALESDTDTEVIAQLIDMRLEQGADLITAVRGACQRLKGSYAFGALWEGDRNHIVAAKNGGSPMIIGLGDKQSYLASDIPAVLPYTRQILFLQDGEFALLSEDDVQIIDAEGRPVDRDPTPIQWDPVAAEKGGYDRFMQKEIFEQPRAITNTIGTRLAGDEDEIDLDGIDLSRERVEGLRRVYLVACGTAHYACMVGKYMLEQIAGIRAEVDLASEFRYRRPLLDKSCLVVPVSQSGETADTLAALREARSSHSRVLSICNVRDATIARESDDVLYTNAGPEIGVASTKAFTTQLAALYLLSLKLGEATGRLRKADLRPHVRDLLRLPRLVERVLQLKEISYIHAEGYAAGEMKHGPIALIDEDMPVVVLANRSPVYDKVVSNMEQVRSRDGMVIAIATEGDEEIAEKADAVIYIPDLGEYLTPVLAIVPLQLLAYHVAVLKGTDVDQPRNLAKSVTVE